MYRLSGFTIIFSRFYCTLFLRRKKSFTGHLAQKKFYAVFLLTGTFPAGKPLNLIKNKRMEQKKYTKTTDAVWAGERNPYFKGAVTTPIVNSVAFAYTDLDEWYDVATGKSEGFIYSRNTNPTVAALEEKIRVLENAEAATAFATGMAAISNTLFTFLKPGKRVVSVKDTYGGTSKLFLDFFPEYKVEVHLCETGNHERMEMEIAKGCDLVYRETRTHPTHNITD